MSFSKRDRMEIARGNLECVGKLVNLSLEANILNKKTTDKIDSMILYLEQAKRALNFKEKF